MDAKECLETLLSDSCSNPSAVEGFSEYYIELHCSAWVIIAKPTGKTYQGSTGKEVFEYEIHSMRKDN